MSELRPMINMVNPDEQKRMEEELQLKEEQENKEYLICYVIEGQSESKNEWNIVKGRNNTINFIRGILEYNEEGYINVEESFILVNAEGISLGERLKLREFIDHVNEELDDPICYE